MSTTATFMARHYRAGWWHGCGIGRHRARRAGCRPRRSAIALPGGDGSPSRCGARRSGWARCSSGSSAGSGSGSVTSSAAPAIRPSRSASGERGLVDDRPAAARVDEDRACGFIRLSAAASIRWRVSCGERAVQRDEVALLQQLLERQPAAAAEWTSTVISKPLARGGHRPPDPPAADDPERRAVRRRPQVAARLPGQPLAARTRGGRLGQPARRREQQREGEVGGGVGEHVGGVADRDPARRRQRRRRCCRSRRRSWPIARRRGAASSVCASMRSVSTVQSSASGSAAVSCSRSSSGVGGSSPGQIVVAWRSARASSACPGSARVTKQTDTSMHCGRSPTIEVNLHKPSQLRYARRAESSAGAQTANL